MNYKHIAIIALVFMLAFVVPASAVWSNGEWITDGDKDKYFGDANVVYDPATEVTSKYAQPPEDYNLMTYQGMVYGHLLSESVLGGGERFLFHRIGTDVNKSLVQYFDPSGYYTGYLAPGEYEVILPQGTGSACGVYTDDLGYVGAPHEERTTIAVVAGQKTYFNFIGNSIGTQGSSCTPTISVIDAKYCWGGAPAVTHVAISGWTTQVPVGAPIVNTRVVTDHHGGYTYDHGVYTFVGNNNGDYQPIATPAHDHHGCPNGDYDLYNGYYVYNHNHGNYDLHDGYVAPTHHTEWKYSYVVIDVPEVPAGCQDVKQQVSSVVAAGYSSFQMIFDNAQNPGGIFAADGHTRLAEIQDPAVGEIKTATIKYNTGCGSPDKVVSGSERQIISLN